MRIDSFSVEGLHGFVDASLDFYPDLTVIVGRNGSGKTSVLDFMSHLIRLDFEAIAKANFTKATVSLSDISLGKILIQAENTLENKKISLQVENGEQVEISLDVPLSMLRYGTEMEIRKLRHELHPNTIRRLRGVLAENSEWTKIAAAIKSNTKFTFVRLDRTIQAIDSEGLISYDDGIQARQSRSESSVGTSSKNPIDDVIEVMRRKQLEFRRAADRIQRVASAEFIKLHFSPPATPRGKTPTEKQLRAKLQELKRRVNSSRLIANAADMAETISNFFSGFETLLDQAFPKGDSKKKTGRRTLHEETVEVMIAVKEQQITELLRIFEREQEATERAYQPISNFLDVAAKFLNDSGKILRFSPVNLELGFVVAKSKHFEELDEIETQEQQKVRSVRELSSGERQVLIVLTYLAFLAGKESIFVVDEPELSLHIEWQRELVGALTSLRPENCQIILATHSPEIAGQARQNCKILRPSYFPQVDGQDS